MMTLKHDTMMFERFGTVVSTNGKLEREIVARLCSFLKKAGWVVSTVWDGETESMVCTAREAMELIFNLDEASLRFRQPDGKKEHGVLLVLGNGEDIISDWNYTDGDPDGFNRVMDAFLDTQKGR